MDFRILSSVLTPADSYDLTTLAVVKDELGLTTGANDATLARYLSWASVALAQECNRVFPVETVKDEIWQAHLPGFSRPGRFTGLDRFEVLQLSRWPLVAVASVTETVSSTDGPTVLVDGTDFRIDYAAGQLLRLDSEGRLRHWNACPHVVQFDAGFAEIPGDLADAVTRMVRNRFRAKGRDSFLMSEDIPGVRSAKWWIATGNEAGNMPPDIVDLVENYRMPVIV